MKKGDLYPSLIKLIRQGLYAGTSILTSLESSRDNAEVTSPAASSRRLVRTGNPGEVKKRHL